MMVGDKTLAGDMGFDPLQIADNSEKLAWYREAEVKHARLAMLAAFGWPVSEVLNFGKLALGDGRAPSLLKQRQPQPASCCASPPRNERLQRPAGRQCRPPCSRRARLAALEAARRAATGRRDAEGPPAALRH